MSQRQGLGRHARAGQDRTRPPVREPPLAPRPPRFLFSGRIHRAADTRHRRGRNIRTKTPDGLRKRSQPRRRRRRRWQGHQSHPQVPVRHQHRRTILAEPRRIHPHLGRPPQRWPPRLRRRAARRHVIDLDHATRLLDPQLRSVRRKLHRIHHQPRHLDLRTHRLPGRAVPDPHHTLRRHGQHVTVAQSTASGDLVPSPMSGLPGSVPPVVQRRCRRPPFVDDVSSHSPAGSNSTTAASHVRRVFNGTAGFVVAQSLTNDPSGSESSTATVPHALSDANRCTRPFVTTPTGIPDGSPRFHARTIDGDTVQTQSPRVEFATCVNSVCGIHAPRGRPVAASQMWPFLATTRSRATSRPGSHSTPPRRSPTGNHWPAPPTSRNWIRPSPDAVITRSPAFEKTAVRTRSGGPVPSDSARPGLRSNTCSRPPVRTRARWPRSSKATDSTSPHPGSPTETC